MAVYVDNMQASFGRMKMCHMMADSTEELLAMADEIGVARRWIQDRALHSEHFDISMSKRRLAVAAGAIECTMRDIGMLIRKRKGQPFDQTCITCQQNSVWQPREGLI